MITVNDYMSTHVVRAAPGDGALAAFRLMQREGVRHLPVVDEGGLLVGVVSDRDLRRPRWMDDQLAEGFALTDDVTVQDIMTREVVTVAADAPLVAAATRFAEQAIGVLPVLDPAGEVVGMLTPVDLMQALVDRLNAAP